MSKGVGNTTWTYGPAQLGNVDSDGISFIANTSTTLVPVNVSLSLRCNQNITGDPTIGFESQTTSNNTFVITLNHKAGCGVKKDGPLGFLSSVKWLFIPIAFVLGCYLLLFGTRSIRVLLAFFGGCAGFLLGSAIMNLLWKREDKTKDFAKFMSGLVTSVIVALICYHSKIIARLLTGAAAGFIFLLQIYYLIGFKLDTHGRTVTLF